ncbi:MAG TPA: dienelactone hydrolase family protein [Oculatellaceae cyanobacterium]
MNEQLIKETVFYACPDGFQMPSLLVRPSNGGPHPGILFVIEATGLHAHAKELAEELAAYGYAVFAPDLLARGNPLGCLVRLFKELESGRGRGIDDLLAARHWLSQQPSVIPEQIAVIGFCMGGGFALILSKTGLFKVAADFYGRIPDSLEGACPIFGSFGERDMTVISKVPHLRRELERHAIPHEVTVYPQVGHGFMHEQVSGLASMFLKYGPGRGGYDAKTAADAKHRLREFLKAHL